MIARVSTRSGFAGAGANHVDGADKTVFRARLENFRDRFTASGTRPELAFGSRLPTRSRLRE
jgi:hypothetical protein